MSRAGASRSVGRPALLEVAVLALFLNPPIIDTPLSTEAIAIMAVLLVLAFISRLRSGPQFFHLAVFEVLNATTSDNPNGASD
jgi:hypothetical protein